MCQWVTEHLLDSQLASAPDSRIEPQSACEGAAETLTLLPQLRLEAQSEWWVSFKSGKYLFFYVKIPQRGVISWLADSKEMLLRCWTSGFTFNLWF